MKYTIVNWIQLRVKRDNVEMLCVYRTKKKELALLVLAYVNVCKSM